MKTPFSLMLIILGIFTINAQDDWEHHEIANADSLLTNTRVFSIGDMDGDGDMDIVSYFFNPYNFSENQLFWLENLDGEGLYGPRKNIDGAFGSMSDIITHDMDEDGDIDILYAYGGSPSRIYWLENLDGLGNFGGPIFIYQRQESLIRNVRLADIDNDNDMDLIASFDSPSRVHWFENAGLANFEAPTAITSGFSDPRDIIAVDIDGDNDLDIVTALNESDRKIFWSKNLDGQGNFGPEILITDSPFATTNVSAIDVDNDSDIDLLANNGKSIVLLENTDGDGSFGPRQTIYNTEDDVSFILVHDLDGDGDQDIIIRDSYTNLIWLPNEGGQGNYGQPIELASGFGNIVYGEFVHIDSDNIKDFVSMSVASGILAWHKHVDGSGTFEIGSNINSGPSKPSSVISVDIDNDGNNDVLISSANENSLSWYPNSSGDGSFPARFIISNSTNNPKQIYAEDLDNDNDKEVLYFNESQIGWFENTDGQGNFGTEQLVFASTLDIQSMDIGDIDDDGDLDIMFGTEDGKLYWTENIDGQNSFSTPVFIYQTSFSWIFINSIKLADLDNDGNLDAIIGLKKDEFSSYISLYWLKSLSGLGTFSNANPISSGMPSIYDIDTGDFDADGDLDIVSVGGEVLNDGSYISWHENLDGLGDFSSDRLIWNNNGRPRSVQTMDLDADGDIDILMGASTVGRIAWFPNTDSQGSFSIRKTIKLTGGWAGYINAYAADLNNDDHLDVVSSNGGYNIVQWHENLGTLLTVTVEELEGFILYPNPTQSIINLTAKNPVLEAHIYNELGQSILDRNNASGIEYIDLSNLPRGIYLLQVTDSSSSIGTYNIIKK